MARCGQWTREHEMIQQYPAPLRRAQEFEEPVAILWDIENCRVPSDVLPGVVATNILSALHLHSVLGPVTTFSAYGDTTRMPYRNREGYQRSGVNLIDVPPGRKDAADKAILSDMFLFAMDNRPPATILLISGDSDFAHALHKLKQRGFRVLVAAPIGSLPAPLNQAAEFVFAWPMLAKGRPTALPMNAPREDKMKARLKPIGVMIEEAAEDVDPVANTETGFCPEVTINDMRSSTMSPSLVDAEPMVACGRKTPTAGGDFVSYTTRQEDGQESGASAARSEPGDIEILKVELQKLLALYGGKLAFPHVPGAYLKVFRRRLFLDEYNSANLADLLGKMTDVLRVEGRGQGRTVYPVKDGTMGYRQKSKAVLEADADSECQNAGPNEELDLESTLAAEAYAEEDMDDRYAGDVDDRNAGDVDDRSAGDADDRNAGDIDDRNAGGIDDMNERYVDDRNARDIADRNASEPEDVHAASEDDVEDDQETAQSAPRTRKPTPLPDFDSGAVRLNYELENAVQLLVATKAKEHSFNVRLQFFKTELQELLVSHNLKLLVPGFLDVYHAKFSRQLDLTALGVQDLASLFEKVTDTVRVIDQEVFPGKWRKVLVAQWINKSMPPSDTHAQVEFG